MNFMNEKQMKHTTSFNNAAHQNTALNTLFTGPNALYNALKFALDLDGKLKAQTSRVELLERQIVRDAPKVEFYDDLADSDELFNTAVVAKTLGTGKTRFLNYLRKHKILMGSGNKRNLPYQQHLDAGRLEAAWVNCVDRKTGKRKITAVPLFTGKGVIWIQHFIEQHGRNGL
jgi:anti-repressor protein